MGFSVFRRLKCQDIPAAAASMLSILLTARHKQPVRRTYLLLENKNILSAPYWLKHLLDDRKKGRKICERNELGTALYHWRPSQVQKHKDACVCVCVYMWEHSEYKCASAPVLKMNESCTKAGLYGLASLSACLCAYVCVALHVSVSVSIEVEASFHVLTCIWSL